MTGFICSARLYEYKGVTIEVPGCGPPWPLKASGDPYERIPSRIRPAVEEFWKLSDEEQSKYRSGGGCVAFSDE